MRLNHNCVREILLFSEENLSYNTFIKANALNLKGYTTEEIVYAADKLIEAEFLSGSVSRFLNGGLPAISITSITYEGHQFLDNIRDDGIWKDTKSILSKFSSVSLNLVNMVAGQVISAMIKNQLGV